MTSEEHDAPDGTAPAEDEVFTDAAAANFAADEDARFFATFARRKISRRFISILALVLLVHTALLVAFLWRDRSATMQVAEQEEATPVEIVQEPPEVPKPPPPPPPPPQQKPPEPPRPKEDLSPAMSAPRAPSEDKIKTETKEAKTEAPTKTEVPTQGAPQAAAPAAAPAKETPPEVEKKEAAQEEEKKEAEALDRAKRKAEKKERTREAAKAHSPQKVNPNLLAALGGAPNFGAAMTFARPTPKTKIYGGTEDVRWMSEVEAMLEAKVQQLPRTAHYQTGGRVAICFHVSPDGRVLLQEFCQKSGYPDVDQLAMRALHLAAPFPPPPPGLDRGLVWVSTFDGQTPVLHFR